MNVNDIIGKTKNKVRQGLALSYMFDRLASIGIGITALHFTREFLIDETELNLNPELEPLVAGFLSPSEVKTIYDHPESREREEEIEKLLSANCLCFGLKYKDEIVAYTWCSLRQCLGPSHFVLKEDEAYLFAAYTFKAYRGKNLAPFLRYELYKHLNRMGRTKFYSHTNFFNTPAVKFKKKLGAKPLKLSLLIRLFNKYRWDITLREYQR